MNELIDRVGGVKQNGLPLNYTRFVKLLRLFHIFRTAADNHHDRSKHVNSEKPIIGSMMGRRLGRRPIIAPVLGKHLPVADNWGLVGQ